MRLLKNPEKIYPYMQAFLLMAGIGILASSYCADSYPGWVDLPVAGVVGAVVLALVLTFLFRFRKWWSLAGVGAGLLLFFSLFSGKERVEDFAGWLLGGPPDAVYPEGIYTVLLLAMLLAALGLVLVPLLKMPFIPVAGGMIVFVLLLYWDIRGTEWTKSGVVFLLVYLFSVVVELAQKRLEKRQEMEERRVLVSLAPFFGALFLFLLIAPTAKEAYRWEFLSELADGAKNLAKQVEVRLQYYLEGESIFSFSFSGHGGTGKVGGHVISRDRDYLKIRMDSDAKTSLYVVGSVWDTFEDGQWLASGIDTGVGEYTERQLDYWEMMYALYRHNPERLNDYVKDSGGRISYLDIYTKNVFYMPKYRKLGSSSLKYSWEGENALFEKPRGKDTNLSFSYLQLNLGSEMFDELIRQMGEMSYENGAEEAVLLMQTELGWQVPDELPELLKEREQKIQAAYGKVPELSAEVKDLVAEVTKTGETGYEKLKLLEAFLQNYTYTTSPEEIRGDFLTGFLCETKEGYCTYFATAFVELARYLGFPARYVQGFVADPESSGNRNFLAESGDAHAWVDVYLHGVGWIPFDATPGFGEVRYQPWSAAKPIVPGGAYSEEDYHPDTEPEEEEVPEIIPEMPEKKNPTLQGIRVLIVLAAFSLCLKLLYEYLKRSIERRSEEERYYLYWRRIFYLLASMGMKREEYDTMEDFRVRLRNAKEFDDILPDERFASFANIRYGGEAPKERELKKLAESAEALYEEYKKTHPKARSIAVYWNMILRISG